MKKLFIGVIILFLSFIALPKPASAFEMRSGDNLIIDQAYVVDGALFASGKTVDIAGNVYGDLYCAGQNVSISGTVDGDIMCAGQHIVISGDVTGSVRVMGQAITLKGNVAKTVTVMGQDLTVSEDAVVGKDLFSMTQMTTVNGTVYRDIGAMGEKLFVNGMVGRNMQSGSNDLSFGDKASMGGMLTYWAPQEMQINPNTEITGPVTFHQVQKKEVSKNPNFVMPKKNVLVSIISWLIVGVILVALFPKYGKRFVNLMEEKPGTGILVGLVTTILMPFVVLFFIITILGIPVSILLMMVFGGVVCLSRLPMSYIVGKRVIRLIAPKKTISRIIPVLVGVPLVGLVFEIPVFGWILAAITGLWGTGAFILTLKKRS